MTKRIIGKLHPVRYVVQDNMLFGCIPFIYITRKTFSTVDEAKNNSMSDKNFVAALTDVLKYFRDNGELKKAYEIQKDSLTNMANSPWAKLVIGMLTSKVQEDKVDIELPDIDALIKENTSDEFIEKKINDVLGIKEK